MFTLTFNFVKINSRSGASGARMNVQNMHVPKQNKMAGTVSQERVNETVSQDVELQIFFFNDMK